MVHIIDVFLSHDHGWDQQENKYSQQGENVPRLISANIKMMRKNQQVEKEKPARGKREN